MKGYINKYVKSLLLVATLIISTTLISVPAFAHVGVTPNTAEQGSYGTFSIGGLGTAGSALSNKGYNLFANYKLPI